MITKKKSIALAVCLLCATRLFALTGVVLSVEGKVEIQDGEDWIALEEGDEIDAGAVISTGFKSEAVIALDETTITVRALTRLTLEQLFEQNGNKASTMYLESGSINASVRSEEDKKVAFKVKTPAVTASVRGTDGIVYVNRVVGLSGSWLLTPPEPKLTRTQIQNRHEAEKAMVAAAEKKSSDAEKEQAAAEDGSEPAADVPEVADIPAVEEYFSSLNQSGGVLVHAGEMSTVATTAGGAFVLNTPQQMAAKEAVSTGSATITQSSQESVSVSVPQPPVVETVPETAPSESGVDIGIHWELRPGFTINVNWK